MRLAWRNLNYDRMRFLVTIIGIAFAVFLMVFQGSLFIGFLRAAAAGISAADGDLWITARGVECFEYGAPLPDRFRDIAAGVPGVERVSRIATGFVFLHKPSGKRDMVFVVGAEPGVGTRYPVPYLNSQSDAVRHEAILVDRSNARALEAISTPLEIEMGRHRAQVTQVIDDFGSFLGSPYTFTGYADAARYVGLGPEETSFLVVRVRRGHDPRDVRRWLQERLPDADVWTQAEFERRSQLFWVVKTGAGGAILTGAALGFLVGLVIVSQNIYATTMENIEEFATLKAMGASRGFIRRVVITQAMVSGLVGSGLGLAATIPATSAVRGTISWIQTPWWLPVAMIVVGLLMCALASVISIRKALSVEPARVFRA